MLVEAVKPPEKIGRFYVPEPSRHQEGEGTVVAVGPGRMTPQGTRTPMDLKAGDHVVYNWVNGREVKLDGKTYKLLDAEEILGVIRSDNARLLCTFCGDIISTHEHVCQPTTDGIRDLAEKMENWGNVEPTPTKA